MDQALALGRKKIAIGAAEDAEILEAVRDAAELGLADAVLIGDRAAILAMAGKAGLPASARVIDMPDRTQASLEEKMQALAEGGLRVLRGREKARAYGEE